MSTPRWTKVWEYGWQPPEPGLCGSGSIVLDQPKCVMPSVEGTTMIADSHGSRILECDWTGRISHQSRVSSCGRPYMRPMYFGQAQDRKVLVVDPHCRVVDLRSWPSCTGRCLLFDNETGRPWHAMQMENGQFLVCASAGIFECSFERAPRRLAGCDEIDNPRVAIRLPNGNTLVSDSGGHQVVELGPSGVVWRFGRKGIPGSNDGELCVPCGIQRLANGNTLIADSGNHRVVEVGACGRLEWVYGDGEAGHGPRRLWNPKWAQRLPTGMTLITNTENNCVIAVDPDGRMIGELGRPKAGRCLLDRPRSIVSGKSGQLLITDTRHSRVLEIDRQGTVIWSHGGRKQSSDVLHWPRYADYDGRLLCVADGLNNRIIWLSRDGVVVKSIMELGGYPLRDPHHVSISPFGLVLTDTGNNRVVRIAADGEVVWQCWSLSDPHAAVGTPDGGALIVDTGNSRLVRVDIGGSIMWDSTQASHHDILQLRKPRMLQVLPDGSYLVVDTGNDRILLLDEEYTVIGEITADFTGLRFAYLTSEQTLLVADTGSNRVLELQYR